MHPNYVIIVAGGSGVRMGGSLPKQFIEIDKKSILHYTIERFLSLDNQLNIIVVLPDNQKDYWKEYCRNNNLSFKHLLVSGGITRFHSVKNALAHVKGKGVVAVHDGVRPFVTKEFLAELFNLATHYEAVIPYLKPRDSMRSVQNSSSSWSVVDRDSFRMIKTPQLFRSELLVEAYKGAYNPSFTDDASVVESIGGKLFFTPGLELNIKITKPEDLLIAKALINLF